MKQSSRGPDTSRHQTCPTRVVKVAVVGSGLAGLTAAHSLALSAKNAERCNVQLEVHLFEKASSLGMDSSSISVPSTRLVKGKLTTEPLRVDVPMRSFQGGYYPQLISLYRGLGVQFRPADFTYSFNSLVLPTESTYTRDRRTKTRTTMLYNGQNGRRGLSIPSEFLANNDEKLVETSPLTIVEGWIASIPHLVIFIFWALQMLICYLHLLKLSCPLWREWAPAPREERLDDWTERTKPYGSVGALFHLNRAWEDFISTVVVPLFGAVCTAPEEDIWAHPVSDFLDYIWMGLFTPHYVVTSGVQDVVNRLSQPLDSKNIHLSTHIISITPESQHHSPTVSINFNKTGSSEVETLTNFSHVVLATQANQAAKIISSYLHHLPPKTEQSRAVKAIVNCLNRFSYRPNVVVNHSDDALLPSRIQDWRDLNLFNAANSAEHAKQSTSTHPLCMPPSFTMATHVISRGSSKSSATGVSPKGIYQTTNPIFPPHPKSIISVARMERAILTTDSKEAAKQLYQVRKTSSRAWWSRFSRKTWPKLGPLQGAARRVLIDQGGDEKESWDATQPGIWLCGSYAYEGIPLLEGCVASARNVVLNGILVAEGISSGDGHVP